MSRATTTERSEWEYGLVFGYVTICNHVIVTIINTAGQQAVMYNDLHAKLRFIETSLENLYVDIGI